MYVPTKSLIAWNIMRTWIPMTEVDATVGLNISVTRPQAQASSFKLQAQGLIIYQTSMMETVPLVALSPFVCHK